ncbi:MAG: phosphoenolpyruvate carboxykinase (ATP) [Bacteroidetes bacterium]|nr:phosphoenolpyruvate carboxykinase (ATP) [Bacteroidota bacterium]MBU1485256.1 phosphoenolpyruvate carboxykinase (ATP) [Bacteroidota bacterium]MBU2047296.1 phosphoenolpyruvate carboxykinase (ATP) [Bacteroidota bacterium]MBU2267782.1 phosphoenolpyruvate carboxykinase (ATP) [Bacteroidota bacterium]MBU2375440.1 phosphoenolpyruvate carboxykinase (ATP) [Bacteroidota bacterium]
MIRTKIQEPNLVDFQFSKNLVINHQLSVSELVEKAIQRGEGKLANSGALAVDTGTFTGRSPKDRFIVDDDITHEKVYWGDINIAFSGQKFDQLERKVISYLNSKNEIFVREGMACADEKYRINIKVITEHAFQNLFAHHLFLRPEDSLGQGHEDWTIIAAPGFMADPETDGTRQSNFSILNFTKKIILIGGTAYTGEIKKGIFSVLNFLLPVQHHVLPMHCSANIGINDDTAIFFGLSGTGKTTLSADPDRLLIGDDEHGWGENSVFNFEGGCYAKCVDLTPEKEPEIYNAIKFGSLLENINFIENGREVDFSDTKKTENTRVAYPINYIKNAISPSVGNVPKNIFFLTADAFGVLPPISKLTKAQAMFYFIVGYTAKVAGTETGINEPQATFSACFGKAFLPLHPQTYAELLGEKIEKYGVNVWLVNTGWTGGAYGVGKRIKLSYTRSIISAALNESLNRGEFIKHPIFDLQMPSACVGVPSNILNPRETWDSEHLYDSKAHDLMNSFNKHLQQYESVMSIELKSLLSLPV